jgi:hypothetical protein
MLPFPDESVFLQGIALRSPSIFYFVKYSYALFLFSTPYIGYSIALSGIYIFTLKAGRRTPHGAILSPFQVSRSPWRSSLAKLANV